MRTRREAMQSTLVFGASMVGLQDVPRFGTRNNSNDDKDRASVMDAGMTEAEADAWSRAAECAAAFFALPEIHPSDNQEVASAIHVIQNKLLSRPTYRTYIESAKERRGIND